MIRKRPSFSVILDTNVYISALISPGSIPGEVLNKCLSASFHLILPTIQIEELLEVAQRGKLRPTYGLTNTKMVEFIDALISIATVVPPAQMRIFEEHITSRDPKDNLILYSALEQKARYLVTGDEDLLVLHGRSEIGKLQILKPQKFLALHKLSNC